MGQFRLAHVMGRLLSGVTVTLLVGLAEGQAPSPGAGKYDQPKDPSADSPAQGVLARIEPPRLRHGKEVGFVAFTPDSKRCVSAGNDDTIRLWDVATRGEIWKIDHPLGYPFPLKMSPDGQTLAIDTKRGIELLRVVTGKPIRIIPRKDGYLHCMAFAPDGKSLLTAHPDETLCLWDLTTGELRQKIPGRPDHMFYGIAFSHDGKTIAGLSGGEIGSRLRSWNLTTGKEAILAAGIACIGDTLSFSPDDKLLVYAWEEAIILFDRATAKKRVFGEYRRCEYREMVFSPDGKTIFARQILGRLCCWNVDTGRFVWELSKGSPECMSLSRDGKRLVTGGTDGNIRFWEVSKGTELSPEAVDQGTP